MNFDLRIYQCDKCRDEYIKSALKVHQIKHNKYRIGGSLLLCVTEYCQHSLNAIIELSY